MFCPLNCLIIFTIFNSFIFALKINKFTKPRSQFKRDNKPRVELILDDKTLAILERNTLKMITNCALYDLEKYTQVLEEAEEKFAITSKKARFDKMIKIIHECNLINKYSLIYEPPKSPLIPEPEVTFNATQMKSLWKGIIPGTKWCGVGDQAKNFHDLGSNSQVDRCCRAHDHCPTRISALSAEYGTINLSLYTRSHCTCDRIFFGCLKSLNQPLADVLGKFYFNILQIGCIDNVDKSDCKPGERCNYSRSLSFVNSRQRMKLVANTLIY